MTDDTYKKIPLREIPLCQMCSYTRPAKYDAKTNMGPWAYVCDSHFVEACDVTPGLAFELYLSETIT
jgi:hypothetical protein